MFRTDFIRRMKPVTPKQLEKEIRYEVSLLLFRTLFYNGFLTAEELTIIDTNLCSKYHPILADLYR